MSRLFSLLLVACFITGCTPSKPVTPTIRIGVALYKQDDTFISTLSNHLELLSKEAATKQNIQLNLNLVDARSSQSVQNDQIERFLDQEYDVVCINIVDRTAAAVLIDKAKDANVPLIFFNRQPVEEDLDLWYQVYYIGSQGAVAGILQGELVCNAWTEHSDTIDRNHDGIVQYVMLEGEPGHQDTLLRTEHSIKALSQAGIATQKLDSSSANWQRGLAQSKMEVWMNEFGNSIEVIFSNNDDMALGAIDAYIDTTMPLPLVVGVDGTPPALEAIADGTLHGTINNDSKNQAIALLDLSLALATGESPDSAVNLVDGKYVWSTYSTIDSQNYDSFSSSGSK